MVLNNETMQLIMFLAFVGGNFYRLTKIESRIVESISKVDNRLGNHITNWKGKEKILLYRVEKLERAVNDTEHVSL